MRRFILISGASLAGALVLGVTLLVWAEQATPRALRPDNEARAADSLIVNVDVLTMQDDRLRRDWAVLVGADGVIEQAGRRDRIEAGPDVRVIDGEGGVLLPGLIDMHVHVFDEADLAASLAQGVTTVRNLGGLPFHLPLARRIEDGQLLGPQLVTTGPILNQAGGRNANPLQVLVDSPAEARAAVRRQYEEGYRDLKLYSNLEADSFAAIREEASTLGMTMSGHPVEGGNAMSLDIDATLDAGFATIEHVESIVWLALSDQTDHDRAQALAARFAAANATVTPTLVVHGNLAAIVETDGDHVERADMASFSPMVMSFERGDYASWAAYPDDGRSRMQAFYVEFTGYLHEAGVRLVVGSDAGVMATPHGVSTIEEIDWLIRAGLSPHEALEAATVHPAEVLGLGDAIGRIAPGFRADLVLLDGDPRADMSSLRQPRGVMRNGVWLDEARLAALAEASTSHDFITSWRRLLTHLATR